MYAVGLSETIVHASDSNHSFIAEPRFTHVENFNGVWGIGAKDITIVGSTGTILHGDGSDTGWVADKSPTITDLTAVQGSVATGELYAVGYAGTIVHRVASGMWLPQTSGTPQDLKGLWVTADGSAAVTVGTGGTVLRTLNHGTTWSPLTLPSGYVADVTGVWGSAAALIVAGGDGFIFRSSDGGATWKIVFNGANLPSNSSVYTMTGSGQHVYAVGMHGLILHSSDLGLSFKVEPSPLDEELSGVWSGGPPESTFIVGHNAAVLHWQ